MPNTARWKSSEYGRICVVGQKEADDAEEEHFFNILPEGVMPSHSASQKVLPVAMPCVTGYYVNVFQGDFKQLETLHTTPCMQHVRQLVLPPLKLSMEHTDPVWNDVLAQAWNKIDLELRNYHSTFTVLGQIMAAALAGAIRPKRTGRNPLNIEYWPALCFMENP